MEKEKKEEKKEIDFNFISCERLKAFHRKDFELCKECPYIFCWTRFCMLLGGLL